MMVIKEVSDMSIFDNLNATPAANAAKPAEGSFTFVFNALPESVEEMKRLTEANLDTRIRPPR